jgi:hypothetical protein
LAAALEYAARGLPVFPCNPDNKRPLTDNGFHDATTDAAMVRDWWGRWPDAMIGMPTGAATGFWVLDVDDPAAFEASAPELPTTRKTITGKGYHLFWKWGEAEVRNAQKHPKHGGWPFPELPGAEVRGQGGYVIVPPSRHPSGRLYHWEGSATVQVAPAALLRIVTRRRASNDEAPPKTRTASQGQKPGTDTVYGLAALERECSAIMGAGDGEQESALNEAALKIGALVAGKELSETTAKSRLIAAGLTMPSYDHRNKWTAEMIAAKVERGLADGMAAPRSAPPRDHRNAHAHDADSDDPATGGPHGTKAAEDWPDPLPLPAGLLPVPAFDTAMLPDAFRPWIDDIAERMQVPADFAAVPAMIAAGSVIGNRIAIRPKAHDDWQEVPNLWGMIVGRPGVLKSPTTGQAMKPLGSLAAAAHDAWQTELADWKADADLRDLRTEARKAALRQALKGNPSADVSSLRGGDDATEPTCRRYRTNDTGYQALGELLIQNPRGLIVERDELLSLLHSLDREDASEARGFFLSSWNGLDSYTFDRIGRGLNRHIPNVTVSMFGGTQPAKIAAYVRAITHEGRGDDGLLQRFSMAVWPDMPPDWKDIDRWPDSAHRQRANDAFARLDVISPEAIGAEVDSLSQSAPPFLRLDPSAQEAFREWRRALEARLRGGDLSPHFESHLAKYRKLVPALALITHLVNGGTGPVGELAMIAALAWAEYLEQHAARIYQAGTAGDAEAAKTIIRHAKAGRLEATFTARDIARKNWSPMGNEGGRVKSALDLLEELHWLRSFQLEPTERGGRPTRQYTLNPKGLLS